MCGGSHSHHHTHNITLTRYLPPHSHCCTCDPPLLGTSAHVVPVFRPGGRGQESAGGWRCSRCHTSDVSCCWAGKGEQSAVKAVQFWAGGWAGWAAAHLGAAPSSDCDTPGAGVTGDTGDHRGAQGSTAASPWRTSSTSSGRVTPCRCACGWTTPSTT